MPIIPDNKVLITAVTNPWQPTTSQVSQWVDHVPGRAIPEYARQIFPQAPADMEIAVSLNRVPLVPDQIASVAITPGDNIVFCLVPHGGDQGGKNILGIVAMLAVMVAAVAAQQWWTAPLIAGGVSGSAMGGAMLAGGIMMAGGVLVNTLLKPQQADVPDLSAGSPTYSWDTRQNLENEGIPWPVVYGRCRVQPPLICKYTELCENKQYLNMLYAVADHAVDGITDIIINDTAIEDFDNVYHEIRVGGSDNDVPLENFGDTITDHNVESGQLDPDSAAPSVPVEVDIDPDETLIVGSWSSTITTVKDDIVRLLIDLEIDEEFFEELGDPGSFVGTIPGSADFVVKMRYRSSPAGAWSSELSFPGTRKIFYTGTAGTEWLVNEDTRFINCEIDGLAADQYDVEVKLYSSTAESGHGILLTGYRAFSDGAAGQSVVENVPGSAFDEIRVFAVLPGLGRHTGSGIESITVKVLAGVKISGGSWVNQVHEFTGAQADPIRYQWTFKNLTHGSYQVKLAYAEQPPGVGDNLYMNAVTFSYYQTVIYDDFTYPGASLLAVRALSTDQLNGMIPRISCLVQRDNVSVYTGAAWVDKPSNNPAWAAFDMVTNDDYGYGVDGDKMLYSEFDDWADWCDDASDERDKAQAGTATSVGLTFLTDTAQAWNINAYAGYILIDSADVWFEIASNTATTLTVSGTPAAGAYGIYSAADFGTATAGSGSGEIEDTSKDWTVNQWKGYVAVDYDAGASYTIESNTDDTLTLQGGAGGVNGNRYYIRKHDFKCNIYFDLTRRFDVALGLIETLGWGRVVQKGTSYGCLVDRPGTPVQLFGIGNIVKDTFEIDYLRQENRCNQIECTFYDEQDDYVRKTVLVHRQDYAESDDTIYETTQLDLIGCTRRDLAIYHAQYMLACNQLLKKVVSFQVEVDALAAQAGDLIYVSHDVPQWGYSGRVVSSTNNTVTIDRSVTMQPGTTYQIMIRHQTDVDADGYDDMETGTIAAVGVETTTDEVTLAAGTWTNNPAAGAVYAFGAVGALAGDYRIVNITRAGDLTRKITALEYDVDVYTPDQIIAEDESISDLVLVSDLAAAEYFNWDRPYFEAFVHLTWRGHAYLWYVWYRIYDTEAAWTYWGETSDPEAKIAGDLLHPMTTYQFAVSANRALGMDAEFVDIDFKGYGDTLPPYWRAHGLRVTGDDTGENIWTGLDLHIEWYTTVFFDLDAGDEPGGAGIAPPSQEFDEFRVQAIDTATGTVLREVMGPGSEAVYVYDANVLDTGGYPKSVITIKLWGIIHGCETAEPAVIICTNEAPAAPASVTAYSRIGGVEFTWPENTEADVASYFVRTRIDSGSWGEWENILTNSTHRGLTLAEAAAYLAANGHLRVPIDIEVFVEDKFYLYSGLDDSGTATSVGTNSLTDTTKSWTPDEWAGSVLLDSTFTPFDIASNTATVLTVVGNPAAGAYTIQTPASGSGTANQPYTAYVQLTMTAGAGITGDVDELYNNVLGSGGVTVT